MRFESVGYDYPQRAGNALSDIELELEPGRITALLGAERRRQEHDRAAVDATR